MPILVSQYLSASRMAEMVIQAGRNVGHPVSRGEVAEVEELEVVRRVK